MSNAITSGTLEFWQDHMQAWGSSGLSQRAYCKKEALHYNSFAYQRGRLIKKLNCKPIPAMKFVEATETTAPKEAQAQAPALQFMLPNGVRIGMMAAADAQFIQRVISAVGEL